MNWSAYLSQRGISVISDLFEGQFQSSMECGECKKVCFVDYMYLGVVNCI